MNWRRLNIILFLVFFVTLVVFALLPETCFFMDMGKPWQLQPFSHEDSLSQVYKDKYKILDKKKILFYEKDTLQDVAVILVDAWGVPLDPDALKEEFSFFEEISHEFAIHRRLVNQNVHAESVELRNDYDEALYFFGGDSLEYGRGEYIPKLGFNEVLFCQMCGDSVMLGKLDSVIFDRAADKQNRTLFALTTQTSREGNREALLGTLARIAKVAAKYPDVKFIVQGTHRPILGTPETRRMYHAHWVPVVIINKSGF